MAKKKAKKRVSQQTQIMRADGYVTTTVAAETIGVNVSTVYRWVMTEILPGVRAGKCWYVKIDDLAELYEDNPTILDRVNDLYE